MKGKSQDKTDKTLHDDAKYFSVKLSDLQLVKKYFPYLIKNETMFQSFTVSKRSQQQKPLNNICQTHGPWAECGPRHHYHANGRLKINICLKEFILLLFLDG